MYPPHKATLAVWTTHNRGIINIPRSTLTKLLPLLRQCEQYNSERLKTTKFNLEITIDNLKTKFYCEYQLFFTQVGLINSEILYRSYGEGITKRQKDKATEY